MRVEKYLDDVKNQLPLKTNCMKKTFILCLISLMALSLNAQPDAQKAKVQTVQESKIDSETQDFVDLGLPSGTLWSTRNEGGDFYTYEQALAQFGNSLPTREQMEELKDSCTWTWTGKGYKVVGPNGKSIVLPAVGSQKCGDYGMDFDTEDTGSYWTSNTSESDSSWIIGFNQFKVWMGSAARCSGRSIRLVNK